MRKLDSKLGQWDAGQFPAFSKGLPLRDVGGATYLVSQRTANNPCRIQDSDGVLHPPIARAHKAVDVKDFENLGLEPRLFEDLADGARARVLPELETSTGECPAAVAAGSGLVDPAQKHVPAIHEDPVGSDPEDSIHSWPRNRP